MQNFLRNFGAYLKVPEMKVFWLFLALVLIVLGIDVFYLNAFLTVLSAAILISVGAVMFTVIVRASGTQVQLATEKRRMDNVIASMNDGVIVYDENFTVRLFSAAAERIFDIPANAVVGQTITPESVRNPRLSVLARVIYQSLAPQVVQRSEEGIYPQIADLSFDEPRLELRVNTDRMMDDRGRVTAFLKIIRDRTREVELIKAKSDFITVAAHQLRTPLSAIEWTFQSLDHEKLEDSAKELVQTGLAAANNLMKIVEDLLNVAKIEEGKFGYNFKQTDLVTFLQGLVDQALPIAKEYNVKMYMSEPPEASLPVTIDAERMGLAIANLLENALKYNVPNGQVTVGVSRRTDGPYVQIDIADTGIGMSKETLGKLFTKFFRGENVVAKETEGSGLGLYIVRNIIRRHGGQVWADSELNRGTTFHITIPTDPSLIPQREETGEVV
ncbi:MAG: PAS domain-containing protein [Patescibacteria group bacterium]|nr:PAS domain-containing protein [Patescibacteria group bacterium]